MQPTNDTENPSVLFRQSVDEIQLHELEVLRGHIAQVSLMETVALSFFDATYSYRLILKSPSYKRKRKD